ncbi:MAG: RNA polymerase sigma factor, partial [Gemmatimonadota bacterium]|nr:RNA polymerase sigma factor [Gemmatimonadota bacterium]
EPGPRREPILAIERSEAAPDDRADGDDVARAAEGDTRAFERLYREYGPMVHSLARRMAGSQDADDLTQEVFVRVWKKLDTFRGDAAFSTWLHRVAANLIITRRKARTRRRDRFIPDEAAIEAAAVGPPSVGASVDLEGALEDLPDGARQVFVLYDVQGYRHEEIAGMLGITAGTSRSQLHRARMLLRQRLVR